MDRFKTRMSRIGASIVDLVVIIPILVIAAILAQRSTPTAAFYINGLAGSLAIAYFVVCHARWGQTLGKKVFALRVLDISERPIGSLQALIRSVPQIFSFAAGIVASNPQLLDGTASAADVFLAQEVVPKLSIFEYGFAILNCIFLVSTSKNRALHDYLARTVVVRER